MNAKVWVALQYDASDDMIRLAVVDNGCGFLNSLKREKITEHIEAIHLALKPRVTCNGDFYVRPSESVNQGIGLTVVKEIVLSSQGIIYLASGDALL
jgi:nitrogen fixation/metabolism regulation signal transduction histidine kinase